MRKTYIVTVDVDDEELVRIFGEDLGSNLGAQCIGEVLLSSRFLANPTVELAPDSYQPINSEGTPNA